MTAVIAQPQAKAQDIVAMNVNLMISARHIQKKDLAKALGIAPQTISKKLRSEITWDTRGPRFKSMGLLSLSKLSLAA